MNKIRLSLRSIFFVLVFLTTAYADVCLDIYKRYSGQHTACIAPNPACAAPMNSLTAEDIATIIRVHNNLRSRIATGQETRISLPKASDMLEMVWDEELANVAQSHANKCEMVHDCNDCRRVKNFPVGQNLYQSMTSSERKPDWEKAITSWYDEVVDFDPNYLGKFKLEVGGKAYGHFTQAVWSETWRIGCGYSVKHDGVMFYGYYTCNYGPAGNIVDGSLFKAGEPCMGCPANSCCGSSCSQGNGEIFAGLCKIQGERPVYPSKFNNVVFQCGFGAENICPTEVYGSTNWVPANTLSGSYNEIVLNGGESTTLKVTKPFHGESKACFTFWYSKGPAVAGQAALNSASLVFSTPRTNFTAILSANDPQFSKFSMSLGWNMDTTAILNFSVPPGGPAQYIQIKDIVVTEGKC